MTRFRWLLPDRMAQNKLCHLDVLRQADDAYRAAFMDLAGAFLADAGASSGASSASSGSTTCCAAAPARR